MRTDLNNPLRNSLKTCVYLLTAAMKRYIFKGLQSEPAPDMGNIEMGLASQLRRFRINSKNNSIRSVIKGALIGKNL
jgi:hypothetical protein|tara:strand:- start:1228 stop:1458 length:231 start_codon:yes stop_codon:yes gene_type:complete